MTNYTDKIADFYSRPSCDEHELADKLLNDAINFAVEGDMVIAGERLLVFADVVDELNGRADAEEDQAELEFNCD
ncbi:coil containing protein [Vibrio phage 1.047.O._10N.286.55.F2]|nr:coil containing protein [Vibrio phage 1.047.O._10N.286.55.F2]